jgi:hypothetical protein
MPAITSRGREANTTIHHAKAAFPLLPFQQRAARLLESQWEGFQAAFKRSSKGNLWCERQGETLTVFKRRDGSYGFSIADAEGPRFSEQSYESEDSALQALFIAVSLG